MSPGTRKSVLRSSGLYQMRGSTASGAGRTTARRRQLGADGTQEVGRIAEHRRGRVGVVAVDDDLHLVPAGPMTCPGRSLRE